MDEERFNRQLAHENRGQEEQFRLLARKDFKAKQSAYGSHTSIGRVLRRELIGYIADVLAYDYEKKVLKGYAGKGYANIYGIFRKPFSWPVVAHIGLATLLDYVFLPGTPVSTVHRKIGTRIEDELKLCFYRKANPELFKKCRKDYMRDTAGYRQKVYSTTKLFKMAMKELQVSGDIEGADAMLWHKWPQDTTISVGGWLVDCIHRVFINLTGKALLTYQKISSPHGGPDKAYRFSEEMTDLEQIHRTNELMRVGAFDCSPMYCPPLDWSNTNHYGGYVTNPINKRYPMIRKDGKTVPSDVAIAALNNVQSVPKRINPFVYDIAKYFYDRGESINDSDPFKPYMRKEDRDIPKLPAHLINIPHPRTARTEAERYKLQTLQEEQKKAKGQLRQWHNADAKRRKESEVFRLIMTHAAKFKDEDRFWVPWSFDFRTRMYPQNFIND